MGARKSDWHRMLTAEELNKFRQGISYLNDFLVEASNEQSLKDLFASTILDPSPTSFHEFQSLLKHYLSDEAFEALMNIVINHDLELLVHLGASDKTRTFIGSLSRMFSSRLRRGYLSWMMVPLDDWFRINTELKVRGWQNVYLSHMILKNDGSIVSFSADIPGNFLIIEHIIRHIEGAIQVLSEEAVLDAVRTDKLKELAERINTVVEMKTNLETKLKKLTGSAAESPEEETVIDQGKDK